MSKITKNQREKFQDRVYELRMAEKDEDKTNHKWFPYGIHDASKCLNCGRKVLNDEELEEANESSCEFE